MFWKSNITVLLFGIFLANVGLGQSWLSSPDWNEFVTPPYEQGLGPTVFQYNLELDSIGLICTDALPNGKWQTFIQETASARDPLPEILSFATIQEKLKASPHLALVDLTRHRETLTLEESAVLEIQIFGQLEQMDAVETLALEFMAAFPDSEFFPIVYYFLNKSRFHQNKPFDQEIDLAPFEVEMLPVAYQTDLFRIFEISAWNRNDAMAAYRFVLERSTIEGVSTLMDSTKERLQKERVETLLALENEYAHLPWISQVFPYIRLEVFLKNNEHQAALEVIEALLEAPETYTLPGKLDYLVNLKKQINVALYVNPRKIGVILPLSSTIAQANRLSQDALEGLRLSLLRDPQSDSGETVGVDTLGMIELVFRDSQLNAEATKTAVQELVEDEQVIAIIGPLYRVTSEAAAQEAERLQVPLISLSLTAEIPEIGSYVFRNNQSWQQEMRALARYAIDYKNAKRFLILHPESREGRLKMAFFWDEVVRLGGLIHGGESFKPRQNNFVRQFESLTGMNRYVPEDEKELMAQFGEKQKPIQEFDAIFIPIGNRGLRELRVLLPYSAIYKMQDVLFLGDRGWNNASVVSLLENSIKEAIFVDSFFKQSTQSHVQEFKLLHEQYFLRHLNYQGPEIYTAYAYDTLNILKKLLENPKNRKHQSLRDALLDMPPFRGVTGMITFLENGESHREMKLLTTRSNKIVPVN